MASEGEVGGVYVVVDGRPFPAFYGRTKKSMADRLGFPTYERTGFERSIPVSEIESGSHRLSIVTVTSDKQQYHRSVEGIDLQADGSKMRSRYIVETSRWFGILVDRQGGEQVFFTRELDGGELALCVFEPPERGESFVTFNGLRPEWRVLAYSAHGLVSVLEQSPTDKPGYATINPPGRRHSLAEESRTMSIDGFLKLLREGRR